MEPSVISKLPGRGSDAPARRAVLSEVVFGQRSRNCSGAGICKIFMYQGVRRHRPCSRAMAQISWTGQGILMRFFRHGLCPGLRENYFTENQFVMGEPVPLPPVICKRLGLPPTILPAGVFPICREDHCIAVFFPCNQNRLVPTCC